MFVKKSDIKNNFEKCLLCRITAEFAARESSLAHTSNNVRDPKMFVIC
jgi:hypothetical protein